MPRKPPIAPATRLGAAIDEYLRLRQRQGRSENTVRAEKSVLTQFATRLGGDPWMSQVGSAELEDFFYGQGGVSEACSPVSFNVKRSRMRGFIAYSQSRSWILTDVLYQIAVMPEPEPEHVRLTPVQLIELLGASPWPRDRIAMAISLNLLLRASEIVDIRVGQVDLDAGFVRVWKKKIKKWDRMPISSDLDPELRRWLTHYTTECGELDNDWYLVPTMRFVHWGPGGIRDPRVQLIPTEKPTNPHRIVHRATALAKIDAGDRRGFHVMRRSMASLFLEQNLDNGEDNAMLLTQELLGHKNITTTQRYTGHTKMRARRDAVIRGMPMLSSMVDRENVVPLRAVKESDG